MKKLRRNNQGFTLVEVIVVLVILSILAALLVPSLTGYIDRANLRAATAEARSVLMAAQTIASENRVVGNHGPIAYDAVKALSEVKGGSVSGGSFAVSGGKVQSFTYTATNGTVVLYDAQSGSFTLQGS